MDRVKEQAKKAGYVATLLGRRRWLPELKSSNYNLRHDVTDLGGTLRLGSYPCVLAKDSKSYQLYGTEYIHERHRHRYEVNNDYRQALSDNGMELVGLSPDGHIVEMVEIPDHPWFIGTQAHPEFKSRPNKPHPLFKGFVAAALEHMNK